MKFRPHIQSIIHCSGQSVIIMKQSPWRVIRMQCLLKFSPDPVVHIWCPSLSTCDLNMMEANMLLSNWHSDMETVALAYPCSLLKLPHDISYMLMTQLWARDFFLRPCFLTPLPLFILLGCSVFSKSHAAWGNTLELCILGIEEISRPLKSSGWRKYRPLRSPDKH